MSYSGGQISELTLQRGSHLCLLHFDGSTLPTDVFFGVWADLHHEKKPLTLQAHIVQGQLKFIAPTEGAIKLVGNSIYLEDGRELVIQLEAV